MYIKLSEQCKINAIECMTNNLVALRTMLHLTQAQLANIMGITRQTLVAYETGKRKMTWSTFLTLLFIFNNNKSTKPLLELMGVYPPELKKYFESLDL